MPLNSEISSWIRTQLNEATPVKWTDAEVRQAYDEAQKDFSIRTEILETQVSVATGSGDASYALTAFPKWLKFRKVIYDYGTTNATPLKYFDYQDYSWPNSGQTNKPQGYTVFDEKLRLYFTPNAVVSMMGVYVYSAASVEAISAFSASNETGQLPVRYHLKAAEKAVSQLLRKFPNGSEEADKHLAMYEKYVAETRDLIKRSADDTRQFYFKTYASPGFDGQDNYGSGYTGRPLWP